MGKKMLYNFMLRFLRNSNVIKKIAIAIGLCTCATAFALPTGEQVAHGEVNIAQPAGEANTLHIHQHTDNAIINWQSFNIDVHEKVHFQQPEGGACLNRIDGANGMSQIHGKLSGTGDIFLINPAGVLFGETAQLNVNGLLASTLNMADRNFLDADGDTIFLERATMNGSIINRGVINVAEDGGIMFVGSSVSNEGIINAKMSLVTFVSGEKFTLDYNGDGVINFAIEPVTAPGVDENGQPLLNGVNNSGTIINDAGAVVITARAAQDVFDNIINTSGVIRARSAVEDNGIIILLGDDTGIVRVSGELDVSGIDNDCGGGRIVMFAEQMAIEDSAQFKLAGDLGDGEIWMRASQGFRKDLN